MAEAARSLKVFVSYSRTDVNFADQLVLALEDKGFEAILDRHDMSGGENWRERLGKLILSADAVAFILTAKSAASETCAWEVEEAHRLGKRILPVTPASISGVTPPAALGDLNWIPFYDEPAIPGSGFYYGVKRLMEALSVDLDWLRAQTRYSERAQEWSKARADDLLLRGEALKDAEGWLARTPSGAHPPDLVREYLTASSDAEQHRQAAAKAQLEEREQALKTAEAAVAERQAAIADKVRMDRWLRTVLIGTIALAVVVVITAAAGIWYSTRRSLDANDQRSAQFAQAAQELNNKNDHAKAMLVALAGDPAAQRGWIEPFFRRDGNPAVLAALERAYTHSRLSHSITMTDFPMSSSLTPNGLFFISANALKPVELWRAGDAKPLLLLGDKDRPLDVAQFSANGKYFVSSVRNEPIDVRQTGETAVLWSFKLDPGVFEGLSVSSIAVSDGGETVLAVFSTGVAGVWRRGQDAAVSKFNDPAFAVHAGALSPDGDRLLIVGYDRIEVWQTGGKEREREIKIPDPPYATSFDATATYALTLLQDGKVFIHDTLNGAVVKAFSDLESPIRAVAFSPDAEEVAFARIDGVVKTLDVYGAEMFVGVGGHSDGVITLTYSPDGKQLVSGSVDHTLKIWDVAGSSQTIQMDKDQRGYYSGAFMPDGETLLLGARNGQVAIWPAGAEQPEALSGSEGSSIEQLVPLPDGKRFFSLNSEGEILLRTVGADTPPVRFLGATAAKAIAVSPDGSLLLAGTNDGAALWQVDKPEEPIWNRGDVFLTGVDGVSFSVDGQHYVIGGMARIEVWKVGGEKAIDTFEGIQYQGRAFAFMPAGDRYVMSLGTGDLVMRSIGQPEAIRTFRSHQTSPTSISFSKDGAFMLTAGEDGGRYWRTGRTSPIATVSSAMLGSGLLSPDGKRAIVFEHYKESTLSWTADPMLFVSPLEKTRLACEKLAALGLTHVTAEDRLRYPVLEMAPPDPCEDLGFAKPE